MKKQITEQLSKIIEATKILSPAEFVFAGKTFPAPAGVGSQAAAPAPSSLVPLLQGCFYQYCYVQPYSGAASLETGQVTPNANLVQLLSAANDTRDQWESGWQIKEIQASGQIRAEKYGRTRHLWAGEFLSHQGFGSPPRRDDYISVFFPKESTTTQPGFYFAFSQVFIDQSDDYNLVRFYWNIQENGAPELLRALSQNLNRFQVPYRFKCLNNQLPFNRTDAAVLFLNKKYYRIAAELLTNIYREVKDLLGAGTPLFSKTLAPGLGLAEDPNNGNSFGMHRCQLLAEGLWNAHLKGLATAEEQLQEVIKQFQISGIDLEHPYLNSGAVDQYVAPKFEMSRSA